MATPSTDSAAIKATIKALMSDGWSRSTTDLTYSLKGERQ